MHQAMRSFKFERTVLLIICHDLRSTQVKSETGLAFDHSAAARKSLRAIVELSSIRQIALSITWYALPLRRSGFWMCAHHRSR